MLGYRLLFDSSNHAPAVAAVPPYRLPRPGLGEGGGVSRVGGASTPRAGLRFSRLTSCPIGEARSDNDVFTLSLSVHDDELSLVAVPSAHRPPFGGSPFARPFGTLRQALSSAITQSSGLSLLSRAALKLPPPCACLRVVNPLSVIGHRLDHWSGRVRRCPSRPVQVLPPLSTSSTLQARVLDGARLGVVGLSGRR